MAEPADAEAILALQQLAYAREAIRYQDWSLPPLTQTLEDLQAEFTRMTILKALTGTTIVGSIRAARVGGSCHVGRLMVHPNYERQGIGGNLLKAVEAAFPHIDRFELFTGARSEGSIRLYYRLGYKIFRREKRSGRVTLVYMEKCRWISQSSRVKSH